MPPRFSRHPTPNSAVQASLPANTYVISGTAETKPVAAFMPGIASQMGSGMSAPAGSYGGGSSSAAGGMGAGGGPG